MLRVTLYLVALFLSFNTFSDEYEAVSCFLSEELPVCVPKINDTARQTTIKVTLEPSQPPQVTHNVTVTQESSFSWKDITGTIIAVVAILGAFFNIYNIRLLRKNRLEDSKKEKFSFWLKEIIFPDYLSPILSSLKLLNLEYKHIIAIPYDSLTEEQKNEFHEKWQEEKLKLTNTANHGSTLPYLPSLFPIITKKISTLDDHLVKYLYQDEIIDFSNPISTETAEEVAKEATEEAIVHEYSLSDNDITDIIKNIYEEMTAEQAKYEK